MNNDTYKSMYSASLSDPEKFWAEQAENLKWFRKWDQIKDTSFKKPVKVNWYSGGKLNVSYNCIDRHLKENANKTALIWEADSPETPSKKITYQQLHDEVCRMANVLK